MHIQLLTTSSIRICAQLRMSDNPETAVSCARGAGAGFRVWVDLAVVYIIRPIFAVYWGLECKLVVK